MTPSPLGIKLELTHRCNLRCAFCYTDSPRHTLARTPDLTDDQWLGIVDEALDLGVIETVITGGEPFMRRDLTLRVLRRFADAGVAVNLNTNGWFVDEAVADALAEVPGLHVHISIDGDDAEVHDAARGVPGSWRRAVEAVDRLLRRSVAVSVVHVVQPENEAGVDAFIDQMWWLGVRTIRMTPVAPVGAAASGDWKTDHPELRANQSAAGRRHPDLRVVVHPEDALADERLGDAPLSFLVRPSGAVRLDSLHPFAFGSVPAEPLAACWSRIQEQAPDGRLAAWRRAGLEGAADTGTLPYRDPDRPIDDLAADPGPPRTPGRPSLPRRAARRLLRRARAQAPPPATPDVGAPNPHIAGLLRERTYRPAPHRASVGPGPRYLRLTAARSVHRLNATAAFYFDALADGLTVGAAIERATRTFPAQPPEQLLRDANVAVRALVARGLLTGAPAAQGAAGGAAHAVAAR